jgi:hypothetical protein
MSISVSGKIVKILNCKDSFDFGANSGYIVNNALKQYSGPYKDIEKVVLKALNQTRTTRKHNLFTQLVTAENTYACNEINEDYIQISMSGKEIKSSYNTLNREDDVKNSKGIYIIFNNSLKTIYIGETSTSFHERWTRHYSSPMKQLKTLLEKDDTLFEILEKTNGDKVTNLAREHYYIECYKANSDYKVLGGPGF